MKEILERIIIKTDKGLFGFYASSDSKAWTPEDCFKYCNNPNMNEFNQLHQRNKLIYLSDFITEKIKSDSENWHKDIGNFNLERIGVCINEEE